MTIETPFQAAETLLAPWTKGTATPEANRLDVTIATSDLPAAAQAIADADWGYLIAITGLDPGPKTGELEVLHHFGAGPDIVTLRTRTPRDQASVPSICSAYVYAENYERELAEMFGITVEGSPNPSRLYTSDDWPNDLYPLRKDFDPKKAPLRTSLPEEAVAAACGPGVPGVPGGKFIVPIGPQHPALKEPGHFEFTVEGETIQGASVRLGYVHRGIEKAAEERSWIQNGYLVERVCGICSHHHAYAYTMGVEKLAGVEVPARAHVIRELYAGLERIHSHLLWLGVAAHEAGFDTLFMYSWRDRETIMDLLEQLCGNRVNYSINVLGGVKYDVSREQIDALHRGMDSLAKRTQHYMDIVTGDQAFVQRTRGIGVLSTQEAKRLGVVGPTARASGLKRDIRVEAPYGSYTLFPIDLVTAEGGDLEHRFIVRINELFASYKTLHNLVDKLPPGELTTKMPRRIPAGETISRVEAPRGELFYFIKSNGTDKPERVHIRTPSICNFGSVIQLAVGSQLADIPMLLAGIDPCFSCNDR
jgi:ech hydrogenase subunit E